MTYKVIETRYKGYRFRSRTEARWAVFFDQMGLNWEYEYEGYQLSNSVRYLPDFYLPDLGCYIEIKAMDRLSPLVSKDDINKASILAADLKTAVMVCKGGPRFLRFLLFLFWQEDISLLYATWAECPHCHSLGVLALVGLQLELGFERGNIPHRKGMREDPNARCFFCLGTHCPNGMEFGSTASVRSPRLLAAYDAASSARFEHGETGK